MGTGTSFVGPYYIMLDDRSVEFSGMDTKAHLPSLVSTLIIPQNIPVKYLTCFFRSSLKPGHRKGKRMIKNRH